MVVQYHRYQRLLMNPFMSKVTTSIGFFIRELLAGCNIFGWSFFIEPTLGFLTGDDFRDLHSWVIFCGVLWIDLCYVALSSYCPSDSFSLSKDKSESQSDYHSDPSESAYSIGTGRTSTSSWSIYFTKLIHMYSMSCATVKTC
jgi:hypothetical protein